MRNRLAYESSVFLDERIYPSTEQLKKIFNSSADIICSVNLEKKFVHINDACVQILGYTPAEMIGHYVLDFVFEADRKKTNEAGDAVLNGADIYNLENCYYRKDGALVTLSWTFNWDATEKLLFCIGRDISERVEKERLQQQYKQKVVAQNKEMKQMLERITDGFFAVDEAWRFTYINTQVEKMLGICIDKYLNRSYWECFPGMVGSVYYELYHKAMLEKVHVNFEAYFPPFQRWFSVDAYPSDTGLSVFFRDITDDVEIEEQQKNYKERIEQQNQMLTNILEQMNQGFYSVDKGFRVTYWNKKAEEITGLTRAETLGQVVSSFYNEEAANLYTSMLLRAQQDQQPVYSEHICPQNSRWTESTIYPIKDGFYFFFRDITDKKKSEETLRISNERFRLAAKTDAIYDWDLLTNKLFWGEGLYDSLGYTADELSIEKWETSLHPSERDTIIQDLRQTIQDPTKDVWKSEYQIRKKDGNFYYVYERGFIVRDDKGKAVRVVGVMQDISERKRVEDEMRRLSLVAKETVNAVIVTDSNHLITWVNEAFTRMMGYSFDEAYGKSPAELLDCPESDPETLAYMREKAQLGESFHVEILNRTKDNRRVWWEVYYQPVFDAAGNWVQYFSISTDITERKKVEAELKKLSLVAESTVNAVAICDKDDRVIWVNKSSEHLTGYTCEEAVGKSIGELYDGPQTDAETIQYVAKCKKELKPFHIEALNYRKNGETYWAEISSQPLLDEKGELQYYFSIATDITERKNLEKELDAQRKRTTAAVIAAQEKERSIISQELHDSVNPVLTAVKLYQNMILTEDGCKVELVNKSKCLLQQSINEIRRLSKRLSAPTLGIYSLSDSVHELADLVAATNKFEVTIDLHVIEQLDVSEELHLGLYRILQEHLTNVLKYAEASCVDVSFEVEGTCLVLKVSDDGKGFDTRQKRSGIGITNMMMRAESLNGFLDIKSAPGEGCTLIASLPLR